MPTKTAHLLVRWRNFFIEGSDGIMTDERWEILKRDKIKFEYILNRRILLGQSGEWDEVIPITSKIHEYLLAKCEKETRLDIAAVGRKISDKFFGFNRCSFLIIDAKNVGPRGCVTLIGGGPGGDAGFEIFIDEAEVQGLGSGGEDAVVEYMKLIKEHEPQSVDEVANLVIEALTEVARGHRDVGGRITVNMTNGRGAWGKDVITVDLPDYN